MKTTPIERELRREHCRATSKEHGSVPDRESCSASDRRESRITSKREVRSASDSETSSASDSEGEHASGSEWVAGSSVDLCGASRRASRQRRLVGARALRRAMTAAEAVLWGHLRARRQGFKVRRQHPIGSWVVDFFVASVALAIEVDGDVHDGRGDDDAERESALRERSVTVMRFRNEQVMYELDAVLERIAVAVRERTARRVALGARETAPRPAVPQRPDEV
ncbi:MAG: DUF559 domain-containing protein [Polyangiales bacterium]